MSRKFGVTGKAVIYTRDGAKIVDAEVRRIFNANYDGLDFKYTFDEPHILIGGVRTIFSPAKIFQCPNLKR